MTRIIYRVDLTIDTLYVSADLVEASAPIQVVDPEAEDITPTPYQTADARHDAMRMAVLAVLAMGGEYWQDPSRDYGEQSDEEAVAAMIRSVRPAQLAELTRLDWVDWTRESDAAASYTSCVYGADGTEPGTVSIYVESAEVLGQTYYRWREYDDGGSYDHGEPTLDRDQAKAQAVEQAEARDDSPNADDLIEQIVSTGYFGEATADELREICQAATEHSEGVLLLPAGEFCGRPIGRLWATGNAWLEVPHLRLAAGHDDLARAADALLRAIRAEQADTDD